MSFSNTSCGKKVAVGSGCVKDIDGNIVVDDSRIKQVWKEYFEKLLIEEFEWNKDFLEDASPISGPAEQITKPSNPCCNAEK